MSVLLLLIPVSVALSTLFVVLCVKAIRAGQFDDMQSPAWRMLFDAPSAPNRLHEEIQNPRKSP